MAYVGWRSEGLACVCVSGTYPQLYNLPALPNNNWCAATSSTGSSVILPLRPKTGGGYVVEYAMFGGHTSRDNSFVDPNNVNKTLNWSEWTAHGRHGAAGLNAPVIPGSLCPADWCSGAIPALAKSFRLRLDVGWPMANAGNLGANPFSPWNWVVEDMPVQRNQGVAILLPNGMVLLISGGQVRRRGHWSLQSCRMAVDVGYAG